MVVIMQLDYLPAIDENEKTLKTEKTLITLQWISEESSVPPCLDYGKWITGVSLDSIIAITPLIAIKKD